MNQQEQYMKRALELAKTAMGHTSPNPMVGCVVVKNGAIVAQGCHEKYGEFHAERNALTRCKEDVSGADLYVTLEPCCHHGKTPPCTDIIIERKIGRVFVGAMDPNPKVAGNGVRILREHGIEVQTGILEKECLELNEIFFHYIQTGSPYVAMKYAMTLDGKIAAASGDSKWVTEEKAREHVHFLRKKYSAIMAGVGTVIADDPMLNCRIADGVNPVRVICDSHLRIPVESKIVQTAQEIPTIVVYSGDVSEEKKQKLTACGVELLQAGDGERVDLKRLHRALGEKKIDSVLVEGGGTIHGSLLEAGIVNRVYAYIAPKLIGGALAKTPVEGNGIQKMADAASLSEIEILPLGNDICITGKLASGEKFQEKEVV
jgi:diaminohydroxyphosphoribosylaminopyrimidine deaminase/5-amino-6-(5-phosphoribosylamino)uracil reductase